MVKFSTGFPQGEAKKRAGVGRGTWWNARGEKQGCGIEWYVFCILPGTLLQHNASDERKWLVKF